MGIRNPSEQAGIVTNETLYSTQEDDFLRCGALDGEHGQWGWFRQGYAAGGIRMVTIEAGHPGIISLTTQAIQFLDHWFGTEITGLIGHQSIRLNDVHEFTWIARLLQTPTEIVRIGMCNDYVNFNQLIMFNYDSGANPNWRGLAFSGGLQDNDTGVAADLLWHKFTVRVNPVASVDFYIDDVLVATETLNIPWGVELVPIIIIQPLAGLAKTLHLDYFRITMQNLNRA